MGSTVERGRDGESRACLYLESLGYRVLARNFTVRGGELDIVALDRDVLVFVEVKTWRAAPLLDLERSITEKKMEHLQFAAQRYLLEHSTLKGYSLRFDLIFVSRKANKIDHWENITL